MLSRAGATGKGGDTGSERLESTRQLTSAAVPTTKAIPRITHV